MANATHAGRRLVGDRPCELYLKGSWSLCLQGSAPVELNATLPAGNRSYALSYRFGPLREAPDALFERPEVCDALAPPCKAGEGKAPEKVDAYVYHPGMSEAAPRPFLKAPRPFSDRKREVLEGFRARGFQPLGPERGGPAG